MTLKNDESKEKLQKLDSIISTEYENINGIVVLKNGSTMYENYFNGFGPESVHHIASATKSVLSALVGIAIEKGYIKSVNQKIMEFFPEFKIEERSSEAFDGRMKEEITLQHLLTMTVPYPFEDWQEPLDKLCMQPDWIKYTLDIMGQNGKLGAFKYSTAGAHLISAILTRATGKSAREFGNEHLFKPAGMKEIPEHKMEAFGFEELFGSKVRGWVNDPNGNSTGGWGLTMSPRDMARFGTLYLNQGRWEGNQIIPETWIKESTAVNPNNYGYLWWLRKEENLFSYAALGDGGNAIFCIPEKNLVVAIASSFMLNPKERWTLVKENILPNL